MIKQVQLKNNNSNIIFANGAPLVIIAGINVLESRELALQVAEHLCTITAKLNMPLVFKASFDKANRSAISAFRGPGLEAGLAILQEIKTKLQVPILTDVHTPQQAAATAAVADILQVPAFLCRQTDLITAIAQTQKIVHIKKAQFLAPAEMQHIVQKCASVGNQQVLLCERGTMFGYKNLVVDMLAFPVMKQFAPVTFDVTHALQLPGGLENGADGRREHTLSLAASAVVQGIAGLFFETHPDPDRALCDGPSALPLAEVAYFLQRIKKVDGLTKNPNL